MNALINSTAFCPSSLQLNFPFNRQKTPSLFLRSRFSEFDRRRVNLVWIVVRSSGVNGYGLARRWIQVSSWMNPKSSSEDFSGWDNADGELQPSNSRLKQSLVGKNLFSKKKKKSIFFSRKHDRKLFYLFF